jgi:hypothetical protein
MTGSLYSKITDVSVSRSGQYFKEGHFLVKIDAVKEVESQAGVNKLYFVIETTVLESDNPHVKVGGSYSQVIDTSNVMFLPNVKGFMAAVSGVEGSSETVNEEIEKYWEGVMGEHVPFERICELVVSEGNPLEGIKMELVCTEILTKAEKKPFTKHMWQVREDLDQ